MNAEVARAAESLAESRDTLDAQSQQQMADAQQQYARAASDHEVLTALETVPGVADVATIGGFVRQYQVPLDPAKLLACNIPLSTVIDRVKASTKEVGGRVLDVSGAQYMIRGLGYLRSLDDLRNVAVSSKDGTPVLLRDLGTLFACGSEDRFRL